MTGKLNNKTAQSDIMRHVLNTVQHANEAIEHAVEAGLSIELVRVSRYHDTAGNWGDQMAPAIRPSPSGNSSDGHSHRARERV
jgi:hypothetical protein